MDLRVHFRAFMVNVISSHVFVMWSSFALLAHVSLLRIFSVASLVVAFSPPHLCYSYYEYTLKRKRIVFDRVTMPLSARKKIFRHPLELRHPLLY